MVTNQHLSPPSEIIHVTGPSWPDIKIIKETVTAKSRKLNCNWKVEIDQDIDYLNQYYIGKGSPEKFFEKAFEDERRKRNREV